MKKYSLLFCFLNVFTFSFAQKDHSPTGAKAIGMANAVAAVRDEWALFNNIAGLAGIESMQAGLFYENRFLTNGFNTLSAFYATPIKEGAAGVSVTRLGNELYNEMRIGAGYSHQIAFVSLGAKLDYMQISVDELGTRQTAALHAGGIAEILPKKLFFGAHIFNINQAKMATYRNERIPTVMKAGFSYQPFEKLMINVETEKDVEYAASFKGGVAYTPIDNFSVRTGVSTEPFIAHFGAGFNNKRFRIDYALTSHQRLGISNALSISFIIKNKKQDEQQSTDN
jgi:hypothetical protein